MNSELPASPLGVVVDVARGAVLVNVLLRARFLAGMTAASLKSVRRCLPSVFFGSLALGRRGTPFDPVTLTTDEVESDLLPLSRACVGEKAG